jgi:hypothetical protein
VFEAVEADVTNQIGVAAAALPDAWEGFKAACLAFLHSAAEADVRQILLLDGRAVLGWDEWHGIMARYGLGVTRAALGGLMEAGLVVRLPLEAFAALVFGALNEAAVFVATAENPRAAETEMSEALSRFLEALRTQRPLE